jgi:GT2 family glycosyltransferase
MSARTKAIFWGSGALLVYAQAGYGGVLALLDKRRRDVDAKDLPPETVDGLPTVTVIVSAYREEDVIARRIANLRAQDYPAERLRVVVVCDGSPDRTPQRAREAGADEVLELPRGGKIAAQDAGVRQAQSDIVAFSDANATWETDALRRLAAAFADPEVGYVCGKVTFVAAGDDATNQEGVYWRYEMWLRGLESRLASITGGNGAIYATRREDYIEVDPVMGHDLTFPFRMVKRGRRAVYAPQARATEKMTPSVESEFARKRRMMSHVWPIVLRGGMLSPRGYPPLYGLMLFSHRVLRYATPFLHLALLAATARLLRRGRAYRWAFAGQAALLAAAATPSAPAPPPLRRPLLIARYYVLTTASPAAGLYDWLRHGTPAGWEPAEGTR